MDPPSVQSAFELSSAAIDADVKERDSDGSAWATFEVGCTGLPFQASGQDCSTIGSE